MLCVLADNETQITTPVARKLVLPLIPRLRMASCLVSLHKHCRFAHWAPEATDRWTLAAVTGAMFSTTLNVSAHVLLLTESACSHGICACRARWIPAACMGAVKNGLASGTGVPAPRVQQYHLQHLQQQHLHTSRRRPYFPSEWDMALTYTGLWRVKSS